MKLHLILLICLIPSLLFYSCKRPTASEFERRNGNDPNNPRYDLKGPSDLSLTLTNNKEVIIEWDNSTVDDFVTSFELSKTYLDRYIILSNTIPNDTNKYVDKSEEVTPFTKYHLRAIRQLPDTTNKSEAISAEIILSGFKDLNYEISEQAGDQAIVTADWSFYEYWPFTISVLYQERNSETDIVNSKTDTLAEGSLSYQSFPFQNNYRKHYFLFSVYLNPFSEFQGPVHFQPIDTREIFIDQAQYHAPTNLEIEILDEQVASLTWEDNSSIEDGFKVYRSYGDAGNFELIATLDENSTSFVDDINPFVYNSYIDFNKYALATTFYRVEALKDDIHTEFAEKSFHVNISNPRIFNYKGSTNSIELIWENGTINSDPYPSNSKVFVERSINNGPFTKIAELSSDATSYTETDLNSSSEYSYRISTEGEFLSNPVTFHYAPALQREGFISFESNSSYPNIIVGFSENDTYLVASNAELYGDNNQEVILTDVASKKEIYRDNPFGNSVTGVDVHEGRNLISSASTNNWAVTVKNFITGETLFEKTDVHVYDVEFSPDGQFIYTLSANSHFRKYEIDTGAQVIDKDHSSVGSTMRSISVSPTGDSIAYSITRSANLISSSGEDIDFSVIIRDLGAFPDVAFSPDGKYLTTIQDFSTGVIQRTATEELVFEAYTKDMNVGRNDKGAYHKFHKISSYVSKTFLHYFDVTTGETLFYEPFTDIFDIRFSNTSDLFAVGTSEGIHLLSPSTTNNAWQAVFYEP